MASEQPSSNGQTQRDTRRVLQVLLPTLPPPAIDLVHSTLFASISGGGNQQRSGSNSGRFRLRRVDSGELGTFSIVSPVAKSSQEFCGALKFDMDPASAELQDASPIRGGGRKGRR